MYDEGTGYGTPCVMRGALRAGRCVYYRDGICVKEDCRTVGGELSRSMCAFYRPSDTERALQVENAPGRDYLDTVGTTLECGGGAMRHDDAVESQPDGLRHTGFGM